MFVNKNLIYNSSAAFWATYGSCEAAVLGGRIWIHVTGSTQKASELLGTIGKATFRRRASVFCLTAYVAYKTFSALLEDTRLSKHTYACKIISGTVGIATGLAAASLLTHLVFSFIKCASIAIPLILHYGAFKVEQRLEMF